MTNPLEPLEFPETVYPAVIGNTQTHPADPLVVALNRLAAAIEEANRNRGPLAAPQPPQPILAPLPPVGHVQASTAPFDGCPIHHQPWKVVPAGISKKTGKSYDAFRACSVSGCDQRPR